MADGNVVQFYGAANPPATYGGVGGTTRKFARYGFLIPDTFTEEAVSKVDKGSGGVDCRFATGTCYHQARASRADSLPACALSSQVGGNARPSLS
jgi:hypothetical protein